jgi:hypothetical protein
LETSLKRKKKKKKKKKKKSLVGLHICRKTKKEKEKGRNASHSSSISEELCPINCRKLPSGYHNENSIYLGNGKGEEKKNPSQMAPIVSKQNKTKFRFKLITSKP